MRPKVNFENLRNGDSGFYRRAFEGPRNLVFALSIWVLGVIYIGLGRPGLPDKYGFDAELIQGLAQEKVSALGDANFENVAFVYRELGFGFQPEIAGIFSFSIFYMYLTYALRRHSIKGVTLTKVITFSLAFVAGVIYCGQYSKEAVQVVFMIPFLLAAEGKLREWQVLLSLLVYSYFFRTYWFLTCAIFILIRISLFRLAPKSKSNQRFLVVFLGALLFALIIPLLVSRVTGQQVSEIRNSINSQRIGSNLANSAISNVLPGVDLLSTGLNYLATLTELVFPFPLVVSGGIVFTVFLSAIVFVWFQVGFSVWKYKQPTKSANGIPLVTALFMSFVSVSAIFEPDFGSYFRHLTPLLPLVFMLESDRNIDEGNLLGKPK
jgi:hypothetical protein